MDLLRGGIPLYLRLADILRRRIQGKEYPAQIPPESILQKEFGVSRFTVRQAIDVLRKEGLLYAKQGVGTLLSARDSSRPVVITGDLEGLVHFARGSKVRILRREILRADQAKDQVAEVLMVPPEEKIFCLTTLRVFEKHPFSYSRIYFPESLSVQIPSEEMRKRTVFRLIEAYCHIPIVETVQRISAVTADRELVQILKVKKGDPLLYLHRTYHASDGKPVELSVVFYDVKRLEYTIRLMRQAAPGGAPPARGGGENGGKGAGPAGSPRQRRKR